jgi:type IV pilus biogenesis protein CpaD/CtpE
VTVAQIQAYVETAASILESETAPSLDRILAEHGHTLTVYQLDNVRRVLSMIEKLYSDLEKASA